MMKKKLTLKGLTCVNCVNKVADAVSMLPGVYTVEVKLEEQRATVEFDETVVNDLTIRTAVATAGYQVLSMDEA